MQHMVGAVCPILHVYIYNVYIYMQGYNARKVNCGRVYSEYILKPVLSGRNLWTRIDASVFV